MYSVYEVFPDGRAYWLSSDEDKFECECWARNHETSATYRGLAKMEIRMDY